MPANVCDAVCKCNAGKRKASGNRRPSRLSRFLMRRLNVENLVSRLTYRLERQDQNVRIGADLGDFEEIIGNLLSNARRFSDGKDITISLAVHGKTATLRIRNEGPVIERGMEDAIFRFGTSFSPANDEVSHGLGLFLVRSAVSAMGGTVRAINDPAPATHGVTFEIQLPVAHSQKRISVC